MRNAFKDPKRILIHAGILATAIVVVGMLFLHTSQGSKPQQPAPKEVSLSAAIDLAVVATDPKAVTINDGTNQLQVIKPDKTKVYAVIPIGATDELTTTLLNKKVNFEVKPPEAGNRWVSLIVSLLPTVLLLGIVYFVAVRLMGGGNKKMETRSGEIPDTRLTDVIGMKETVDEMHEVVALLHDSTMFSKVGAVVPRGFLLVGDPGVGKTLIARAVAGEAKVPFFATSGSEFVDTFVGRGASRVRDLFKAARKHPAAIVFIDEIDAIGRSRGGSGKDGAGELESERTLNQLLVELDGFDPRHNIIVIAATNRPEILDSALTRAGRFDRRIEVHLPDKSGREAILRHYGQKVVVAEDITWASIARRTPGMSGAQLSQLVNEAALAAGRSNSDSVNQGHFDEALQTVALGKERRGPLVSSEDLKITAWHEAGHTLCALLVPGAQAPVQVSIVPRGRTGGATWMSGSDDSFLRLSQAKAQLVVAMGGRAGEELLLQGDFTTGAHGDLMSATNLAHSMVTHYAMTDRLQVDGRPIPSKEVSESIEALLNDALIQARELLGKNQELLAHIANTLLAEETLDFNELAALTMEFGVQALNELPDMH